MYRAAARSWRRRFAPRSRNPEMGSGTCWCGLRPRIHTASGPPTPRRGCLRTVAPTDRLIQRTPFGIQGGRIWARCIPHRRGLEFAQFLPAEHDRAEMLEAPVALVERTYLKVARGRRPEALYVWRHRK